MFVVYGFMATRELFKSARIGTLHGEAFAVDILELGERAFQYHGTTETLNQTFLKQSFQRKIQGQQLVVSNVHSRDFLLHQSLENSQLPFEFLAFLYLRLGLRQLLESEKPIKVVHDFRLLPGY